MLMLAAILVLILMPFAMLASRLARPKFAYHWLMALGAVLAAWILVLLSRGSVQTIQLAEWQTESLVMEYPILLLDTISWSFSLAVTTLALAVILTAVVRLSQVQWQAWASTLMLAGVGLVAILAGNPLTLMLSWAALDFIEIAIVLIQIKESQVRERAIVAFSARVLGIAILVWAMMVAHSQGAALSFTAIPAQITPFLLMAASLRLGVVPLQATFFVEITQRRGLGTSLRLAPAASSLALLVRAAASGAAPSLQPYLLALVAITAVYSGIAWMTAKDELVGRPFWILGMSSLAVASAVRGQPNACLAWGVATIFAGGFLFLASQRHRNMFPLVTLALVVFSALPFTTAWGGMRLYMFRQNDRNLLLHLAFSLLFFLTHLQMIFGYLRHWLRPTEIFAGTERWIWVIYPLGLMLLPLTALYLGWQIRPAGPQTIVVWLGGGAAFFLGVVLLAWRMRGPRVEPVERTLSESSSWGASIWGQILSLRWFYDLAWRGYIGIGWVLFWFNRTLEREGGILWALLLLIMLYSLSAGLKLPG